MNTRMSQMLLPTSMAVTLLASSVFAQPAKAPMTPEEQVLQGDADRFVQW